MLKSPAARSRRLFGRRPAAEPRWRRRRLARLERDRHRSRNSTPIWARTAAQTTPPSSSASKDAVLDSSASSASMSAQQRVLRASGQCRRWGTRGGGDGPVRVGRSGARNTRLGMRKIRGVAHTLGCVRGSCVSNRGQGRCRRSGYVVEEEQGDRIERGYGWV